MPITGLPLPFISYGGSSIVTFFALMGLVQSVHMRRYALSSPGRVATVDRRTAAPLVERLASDDARPDVSPSWSDVARSS